MRPAIIFDLDGCLVDSEVLALKVLADEARGLGAMGLEPCDLGKEVLAFEMARIAEWVGNRAGRPCDALCFSQTANSSARILAMKHQPLAPLKRQLVSMGRRVLDVGEAVQKAVFDDGGVWVGFAPQGHGDVRREPVILHPARRLQAERDGDYKGRG